MGAGKRRRPAYSWESARFFGFRGLCSWEPSMPWVSPVSIPNSAFNSTKLAVHALVIEPHVSVAALWVPPAARCTRGEPQTAPRQLRAGTVPPARTAAALGTSEPPTPPPAGARPSSILAMRAVHALPFPGVPLSLSSPHPTTLQSHHKSYHSSIRAENLKSTYSFSRIKCTVHCGTQKSDRPPALAQAHTVDAPARPEALWELWAERVTSLRGSRCVSPAGPGAEGAVGQTAPSAPGRSRRVNPKPSGDCSPFTQFRVFSEPGLSSAGATHVSVPFLSRPIPALCRAAM